MHTIEEQEVEAYLAGNLALAGALAQLADAQDALATEALAREDLQDEIAHLKSILADALADDSWRERAQAAIED